MKNILFLSVILLLTSSIPIIAQDLLQLTNNSSHEMRPEWSPDGNTIGFISNRGGSQGYGWYGFSIWKIPSNGGATTKIETGLKSIHQMIISPDGNTIVFYAGQNEPRWDIYKILFEGGQLTPLTNNQAGNMSPRFSPDGTQLVFASKTSGNLDIWTMDLNGDLLTQITFDTKDDLFPCFSPNGQKIAFSSKRNGSNKIFIKNLENQSITQLTFGNGADYIPAWSPNGQYIAYASTAAGSFDIYIIPADGGESMQITSDAGDDMYPSWSPDGTKIAFSSNRTGNDDIWIKTLDLNTFIPEKRTSDNLFAIFKNPYSSSIMISFTLEERKNVRLDIIDSTGRIIQKILNKKLNQGSHQIPISNSKRLSGMHFIRMKAGKEMLVKKWGN